MTDRLHVDPLSLEGIADQLRRSGDTLRAAAGGGPGTPDAGTDTPIFEDLITRLVQDATALAGGLDEAASRVLQASRTYADEDLANARDISGSR
ncbi:hypothetical protein Aph02nite_06140 [Actinoplanes philippinensis]|uniref:Excreted virulence factor EspC, type VII ESX diderm n=1 Tax=Actinoplanes philippinensis TaxID=35752 RepID=A0A1I2CUW7_9ACTN|nr:hypothetical protein [Actinoplanes philippinensis]GIE74664.1 hypothetical protein Aph02nite_06140 [Actinoplanes philippinensis]SFE72054.1 hypothetical protein SAMN05421541_103217 [Actinoplanes philippinensis]